QLTQEVHCENLPFPSPCEMRKIESAEVLFQPEPQNLKSQTFSANLGNFSVSGGEPYVRKPFSRSIGPLVKPSVWHGVFVLFFSVLFRCRCKIAKIPLRRGKNEHN